MVLVIVGVMVMVVRSHTCGRNYDSIDSGAVKNCGGDDDSGGWGISGYYIIKGQKANNIRKIIQQWPMRQ